MISRFTSFVLAGTLASLTSAASSVARAQSSTSTASSAAAAVPAGLKIKRTPLPASLLPACPVTRGVNAEPNDAQRRQARDFAARSQQDAILGDSAAALTHLRDARRLDPTDPDIAYQLARGWENATTPDSAVVEYCRFLALAPRSADAGDARDRIAVLAKPTVDPIVEAVNTLFQQGLAAYDAGRMPDADARFTRALETQPAWADVYFNRAVTRLVENDREGAAGDFEVYLRLKPTADDRQLVSAQLPGLRRAKFSAAQALALGIFIPGAGQFYTNRPGWGTTILVAAGGLIGAALVPETKTETVRQSATDPFGNPYTFTTTRRVTDHPLFIPGLAAAGAIALIGATEAYVFANNANAAPSGRVSMIFVPATQSAVGMRITF
jgi:Tfp pilus assembly protein PilF